MRRCQSGWELDGVGGDIRATWSSETVSTAWTAVVDATAARTGGYGLHVTRTAVAAATAVGGYQEITLQTGNPRWTTAPMASGTDTPFLGTGAGEPRRCWLRVYHKPVVKNATGNFYLLELRQSGTNCAAITIGGTGASDYRLRYQGTDKGLIYAPTVGNWYRLELMVEIDAIDPSGGCDIHVTGWVYAATGTTPLGLLSASGSNGTLDTDPATSINVGYRNIGFQSAVAQEGYFDDFAVNDDLIASGQSGIHVQSPWGGACRGVSLPSGIGSNSGWTPFGSANNFQNVDEWVYDDATTYNQTPAAVGTPKDSHQVANPTIPGSEVIKSASVICRAQDGAGGFPYYRMGLLEGGTDLEVNNNQTGGWFHNCAAVGEVGGGGAWTNAKANAAEVMYRKTTSDATAQQDVSAIACEWEDNDGLGDPPALGAKQKQRGGVH